MLMETALGSLMLPNELLLLKVTVGLGFLGWMTLMLTQVVILDHFPRDASSSFRKPSKGNGEYKKEDFKKAA